MIINSHVKFGSYRFQGARLTHDHNRQYQFALQTMTLWREVQNDMFKLWCLAEDDLLDPDNYYSLRDTGQVNINTFAEYIPRIK